MRERITEEGVLGICDKSEMLRLRIAEQLGDDEGPKGGSRRASSFSLRKSAKKPRSFLTHQKVRPQKFSVTTAACSKSCLS